MRSQEGSLGTGRLSHSNRPAFLIFPSGPGVARPFPYTKGGSAVSGPEALKEPFQAVVLLEDKVGSSAWGA